MPATRAGDYVGDAPSAECPVCHTVVRLKADGKTLWAHRAGGGRSQRRLGQVCLGGEKEHYPRTSKIRPHQAAELRLVTVEMIRRRFGLSYLAAHQMTAKATFPYPVGVLVQNNDSRRPLLYSGTEVMKWVRRTHPEWVTRPTPVYPVVSSETQDRDEIGVDPMSSTTSEKWTQLSKRDLTFADDLATDITLTAMAMGGQGRISRNGHIIIRHPNGTATMSIARKLNQENRAAQNAKSQFKRLFGMSLEDAKDFVKAIEKEQREVSQETSGTITPTKEPTMEWVCEQKECGQEFATQGALYDHIQKMDKHHKCSFTGCWYVATTAQGASSHYRIVHENIAPRRGKTKEVIEAKRRGEVKQEVEEPTTSPSVDVEEVKETVTIKMQPLETESAEVTEDAQDTPKWSDLFGIDPNYIETPEAEDVLRLIRAMTKPWAAPEDNLENTRLKAENEEMLEELVKADEEIKRLSKERDDLAAKITMLKETLGL